MQKKKNESYPNDDASGRAGVKERPASTSLVEQGEDAIAVGMKSRECLPVHAVGVTDLQAGRPPGRTSEPTARIRSTICAAVIRRSTHLKDHSRRMERVFFLRDQFVTSAPGFQGDLCSNSGREGGSRTHMSCPGRF
jgi:hypothetical protein